jgi:hypothetical protein
MHHPRDASSKGRITQGSHHLRDATSKGRIIQGTHHPRSASFGNTSFGDTSSWHHCRLRKFLLKLKLAPLWRSYFLLLVSHVVYLLYEVFKIARFSHVVATFAKILIATLAKISLYLVRFCSKLLLEERIFILAKMTRFAC